MKEKDNPGVYVPPPLLYVLIFIISILIQKGYPLPSTFFEKGMANILGIGFIILGFSLIIPALIKFLKTRNTLITIKPAHSLQTSGIYSISRNPMYLGLLNLYIGIAFLMGNLWTFLFVPVLVLIITYWVIIHEERYLTRRFGDHYTQYKIKVRRWI